VDALSDYQSGMEIINKIWEPEKIKRLKVIMFLWRWWSVWNKVNDGVRLQFSDLCSKHVGLWL
jgi:hypothetical protein